MFVRWWTGEIPFLVLLISDKSMVLLDSVVEILVLYYSTLGSNSFRLSKSSVLLDKAAFFIHVTRDIWVAGSLQNFAGKPFCAWHPRLTVSKKSQCIAIESLCPIQISVIPFSPWCRSFHPLARNQGVCKLTAETDSTNHQHCHVINICVAKLVRGLVKVAKVATYCHFLEAKFMNSNCRLNGVTSIRHHPAVCAIRYLHILELPPQLGRDTGEGLGSWPHYNLGSRLCPPELDKRCRSHLPSTNNSWKLDETYSK